MKATEAIKVKQKINSAIKITDFYKSKFNGVTLHFKDGSFLDIVLCEVNDDESNTRKIQLDTGMYKESNDPFEVLYEEDEIKQLVESTNQSDQEQISIE